MEASKPKRKLTNQDVLNYEAMVEKFIRGSCMKNWSESRASSPTTFLGNSGFSLEDLRQQLRTEVCVALHNYNPDYRTKEGRSVKESTFVYQHLTFRVGQMMKRLTKRRTGYGIRHSHFELIMQSGAEEQSIVDRDLAMALDTKTAQLTKGKTQVEQWLGRKRQ